MPIIAQKIALVVPIGVLGNTKLNNAVAELEKKDFCPVISMLKHKKEIKTHIVKPKNNHGKRSQSIPCAGCADCGSSMDNKTAFTNIVLTIGKVKLQ